MSQDRNFYLLTMLKAGLISVSLFLTPIKGLLITTGLFVFLDTLFAIYATIKLNGIKSYQSTKLFNIVVKSFFYLGSIILAFFVDTHIMEGCDIIGVKLPISKFTTVFWLYIELKSIDETSQKLGNKPFIDIVNSIVKWLKNFKKDINEIKD